MLMQLKCNENIERANILTNVFLQWQGNAICLLLLFYIYLSFLFRDEILLRSHI